MKYIVDENGEVLETVSENQNVAIVNYGDRVVRNNSIEYLKDTVAINLRFAKISIEAIKQADKYCREMVMLMPYIQYSTGILMYSNGRLVRPRGLASILKRKRRSGSSVIKELIEMDIIHKHVDGKTYFYTFNPYVAIKSRRVDKALYDEFKDTRYRDKMLEFK